MAVISRAARRVLGDVRQAEVLAADGDDGMGAHGAGGVGDKVDGAAAAPALLRLVGAHAGRGSADQGHGGEG